jgi:phospholipid/cholesterol/gamma-HCH transport system substrate-binding protein
MTPVSTPFKVGGVVLLAIGAFFIGLTLIGGKSFGGGGKYTVNAVFDDATGLGSRTRVQVAGIVIGEIDHVDLDEVNATARVFIRVDKKFKLHRDASISKRSESILGDFMLDVKPGSASEPLLVDGDEIKNVIRQAGMNEIFASMSKIADDVSVVTKSLRQVLGSDEGQQNLKTIVAGLAEITKNLERVIDSSGSKLDDTLANFRSFSGDLKNISGSQQENVREILINTRDATAEARDVLKSIQGMVGDSGQPGQVNDTVKSIKSNLDKLDATLANVRDVTDKINKGEGTLGHLVNDDTLAKNLDKASTSITNLLGKASSIELELGTRTELLVGDLTPKAQQNTGGTFANNVAYNPWAKNYLTVRLITRPDKWYGFELVDDPRGKTDLVTTQNCTQVSGCAGVGGTNLPPTGSPLYPANLQQIVTTRTLKYSVYIAKRFGFVSARFGIIESTGGFGAKFYAFNDDLTISTDIYEFANPLKSYPRLKLYADYHFLGHLYATAGIDDSLNKPVEDPTSPSRIISGRDYFLGGGIFFNEDDIKTFLSALPLIGKL